MPKSLRGGSPLLDSNGNEVEDLLLDLNLSTLNTGEITYLSKSNGATSAIDITAIDLQHIAEWRVVMSAIIPIITIINLEVEPAPQNNNSWNFRKANWDKFTDDLDSYCSQITDFNNLEILVQSFNRGVQKVAKLSIPRRKRRNDWMPYWKDHNIDALIHERDSACNDLENNNVENRRKFDDICHKAEEEIAACKREKLADFCGILDPRKDSQHWNVINVLNSRSTQVNNRPTSLFQMDINAKMI
ncbi:reverse transcriptase domain-containing protein [Trichonephila inaurata madagascariensis]|uniref:Reverse transcriptase domain-containing protein n=1 Tax=Trichonephila inaurata madagascariensis TaxID=2747483 RepID=A0A8X6XCF8_9ARAC|nr:reverse transcriptase domain-containing protein [Trichonephila inaurata madagascariensis]